MNLINNHSLCFTPIQLPPNHQSTWKNLFLNVFSQLLTNWISHLTRSTLAHLLIRTHRFRLLNTWGILQWAQIWWSISWRQSGAFGKFLASKFWCLGKVKQSEAMYGNVLYIYMLIRLYLYAALTTQWSLFLLQAFTAHCWFTVDSLVDQASGLALVWRHQTLLKVVICLRSQIPSGKDTR